MSSFIGMFYIIFLPILEIYLLIGIFILAIFSTIALKLNW